MNQSTDWKKFEKLISFTLKCECGIWITGTFVNCTVFMLEHVENEHSRPKKK